MKKYLFFAAAVAITACTNDTLIDDTRVPDTKEVAIGFGTGMNNITRGTSENNGTDCVPTGLENYYEDFKVWGYKNIATSTENKYKNTNVFNGDVVSYDAAATTKWSYSPMRYWDKTATNYEFHAAAPSTFANWTWTETETETGYTAGKGAGKFTITSAVTIANESLPFATTVTEQTDDSFAKKKTATPTNVDLMIANDVVEYNTYTNDAVELDFNHILSRLNIGVQTSEETVYAQKDVKVTYSGSSVQLYKSGDNKYVKVEVSPSTNPVTYVAQEVTVDASGNATKITTPTVAWDDATYTKVTEDDTTKPLSGEVKLVSIKVYNLKNSGTFDESLSSGEELAAGTAKRWTKGSSVETYGFPNDEITLADVEEISVPADAEYVTPSDENKTGVTKYVFQGLIMPQDITYKKINKDGSNLNTSEDQYLEVKYTLDGEEFTAYYGLADIFTSVSQYVNENGYFAYRTISDGIYAYYDETNHCYCQADGTAYTKVAYLKDGSYYTLSDAELYENAGSLYEDAAYNTQYTPDIILKYSGTGTSAKADPIMRSEVTAAQGITFCEGWQNNILIKIEPTGINFVAHVFKWDTKENTTVTVD